MVQYLGNLSIEMFFETSRSRERGASANFLPNL